MHSILGKKIGMTNCWNEAGEIVPVTLVEAGPCIVTQVKSAEKDGYEAVQIGFEKVKKAGKSVSGHLKKAKALFKHLREVELDDIDPKELEPGNVITCEIFKEGEIVDVIGVSKGKGFAGTIKRHNFHRGPETHGSHSHRNPGSIGSMFPQHVFKGTKLPGRMGHERVTVKNLKIEKIDADNNIIAIKGAIPGPRKSLILLRSKKVKSKK